MITLRGAVGLLASWWVDQCRKMNTAFGDHHRLHPLKEEPVRSSRLASHALTSVVALAALLSCGPGLGEPTVHEPQFNAVWPGPDAVRIQAFTLGPNGEILQSPNSYELCEAGFKVINSGTGSVRFERNCETRVVNGYQPYNGGSADIWLFSPSGNVTHLGHLKARYEYIDFFDVPNGWTLRFGAYPDVGAKFNRWYDESGVFSLQPIVDVTAYDGLTLLAELQMNSQSGGGGGDPGGGCQQIVC